MRLLASALLAFGFAGLALSAPAAAQPHHHKHRHLPPAPAYVDNRPPLTVNSRSWLDPGPVVTPGTANHYVVETSALAQTPDEIYFPSRQHEDVMPRPFYTPGSMTPLVEFETPRDPFSP